jgi:hypothetical protein
MTGTERLCLLVAIVVIGVVVVLAHSALHEVMLMFLAMTHLWRPRQSGGKAKWTNCTGMADRSERGVSRDRLFAPLPPLADVQPRGAPDVSHWHQQTMLRRAASVPVPSGNKCTPISPMNRISPRL